MLPAGSANFGRMPKKDWSNVTTTVDNRRRHTLKATKSLDKLRPGRAGNGTAALLFVVHAALTFRYGIRLFSLMQPS